MTQPTKIYVYLFSIVFAYCVSQCVWMALDTSPPQSDSIYYLQGSYHLCKSIQDSGLEGLASISTLVKYRPPMQSIIGSIMVPMVNYVPDQVVFVNIVWILLTTLYIFLITKKLFSEWAGLVAVLLFMSNPFVLEYTPQFEPEIPLLFVAIAFLYYLFEMIETPKLIYSIIVGLLLTFGLLLKWIFALFVIGPIVVILLGYSQFKKSTRWTLGLSCMIPAVLALPWYLFHISNLLVYQTQVAQSGLYTPFHDGWSWYVFLYYPLILASKVKLFHLLFIMAGFCYTIYLWSRGNQKTLILLTSIFVPYLFFLINYHNLAPKYILPLQSVFAVIAASWYSYYTQEKQKRIIHVFIVLCCLLIVHLQWNALNLPTETKTNDMAMYSIKKDTGFFDYTPRPPQRLDIPHNQLATIISIYEFPKENKPTKIMTVPNLESFSAFTLSVWLESTMPYPESMGVSKHRVILDILYHDFIILSKGMYHREKNFQDGVDPTRYNLTQKIGTYYDLPSDEFFITHRKINSFSYHNDLPIELYKRIHPVQKQEAIEILTLFCEDLVTTKEMWKAVDILWKRLKETEHRQRAELLFKARFNADQDAYNRLLSDYEENRDQWLQYEITVWESVLDSFIKK
jgi:hypothetical protein